ncbi:hypothetical protein FNJ84_01460 [Paracoccus sp. M683]|uniref:hypothetical protein n=1 Tax=Paracoccus sp. M683 TaxID=2594268 RepID=UPI00118153A8|nr:hypothetical protein [Paracoccus sp. M683]TRW99369.1 hypothetical protein FNJ84_01460 [Paracoccus sp. M683]
MKRLTDRRAILLAAGTAAAAVAATVVAAQSPDIHGTVVFADGADIPKGEIQIYVEDPAIKGSARQLDATMQMNSDGGSKAIAFTFAPSPDLTASAASPTLRIVARLERPGDGWLLARGSAQLDAGSPVEITLNSVMY